MRSFWRMGPSGARSSSASSRSTARTSSSDGAAGPCRPTAPCSGSCPRAAGRGVSSEELACPLHPQEENAMEIVNLTEKVAGVDEYWSPRIVGELNDAYVKVVKLRGEFVWHHHEAEDELFLVVEGRLRMELRDGEVVLDPGEFVVIPRGVEHRPVAEDEVHVLLLEPKTTVNTGNVRSERTVAAEQRI